MITFTYNAHLMGGGGGLRPPVGAFFLKLENSLKI